MHVKKKLYLQTFVFYIAISFHALVQLEEENRLYVQL